MVKFVLQKAHRFLEGGGAMGLAIAVHDWSATPLGPIENWPPALRIAVSMMVNSAFPKCLCWGEELISIYNDSFVPILGRKHPCLGQPFSETWAEAWDEVRGFAQRALAGEATFVKNFELEIERFGYPETAWFTFCYSPVRDENGEIRGMLDTVMETSDNVRAEKSAALRNRELLHRSRNSFALVSALIKQTHRTSESLDEAQPKIEKRLNSLSRAQDVLGGISGLGASVASVVASAVSLFEHGGQDISAAGPEVRLGSEQVISLAMALHELGTNAAKYGALSVPEGSIAIDWSLERSGEFDRFFLRWTESGGPVPVVPERRGFGSFLIQQVLETQFGGKVTVEYPPTGLRFTLEADARHLDNTSAA